MNELRECLEIINRIVQNAHHQGRVVVITNDAISFVVDVALPESQLTLVGPGPNATAEIEQQIRLALLRVHPIAEVEVVDRRTYPLYPHREFHTYVRCRLQTRLPLQYHWQA